MTPLVDVMLVLLIIFMVTAPLLAAGMKVDLPQAKAARPFNPKEPIVVVVGKDGKVALGGGADRSRRSGAIGQAQDGRRPSRVVHLRGDKDAAYGQMVAVLDELATNGITHIAIVTESARGKQASLREPRRPSRRSRENEFLRGDPAERGTPSPPSRRR